jgi:hypothetical protein
MTARSTESGTKQPDFKIGWSQQRGVANREPACCVGCSVISVTSPRVPKAEPQLARLEGSRTAVCPEALSTSRQRQALRELGEGTACYVLVN